ncbi:MAG: NAD(P)H-dependent oxidoreductase subunit E [Chthonomonadales bacterium]|nr:NAD(P)H-dependent oxidoreductase subunit E [Chthonomonadales bacterium]
MAANGHSGGGDRPMDTVSGRFSPEAVAELEEIVSHYPDRRGAMLPALWIAQREYGGSLPAEAIKEVAERLGCPPVEVEGVASFYTMYNLGRRGRRHLEVCTCLTCAVLGAADTLRALEEKLGIKVGQTTPDGEFSLAEVECLNWCEAGTVVQVGGRYFGNVTPDKVDALVEQIRQIQDTEAVTQADQIVKVQLARRHDGTADG